MRLLTFEAIGKAETIKDLVEMFPDMQKPIATGFPAQESNALAPCYYSGAQVWAAIKRAVELSEKS